MHECVNDTHHQHDDKQKKTRGFVIVLDNNGERFPNNAAVLWSSCNDGDGAALAVTPGVTTAAAPRIIIR
jgi:hypothetical protein